jgi:Ser/Thr protein kinase RdoA (MazF antagonist)
VHAVPVLGFGWIRRDHDEPGWPLRGEHATYADYVDAPAVFDLLVAIGFPRQQAHQTVQLLEEAVTTGPSGEYGCAAHGDFDVSHIFAADGTYTGLIDFGELRGTDWPFDFATLELNAEPGTERIRPHAHAGYAEVRPLPDDFQRRLYVACVLSASHRLATWYRRDGSAAAGGWFFRWIRDRLAELLNAGRLVHARTHG